MSISAMKQALDLLETSWGNGHEDTLKYWNETAQVLRQAIAEAEQQEPVAFRNIETGEFCTGGFLRKDWAKWQPLYAAPSEWVDLTEDEIFKLYMNSGYGDIDDCVQFEGLARVIEAKLKEKNS